MSASVPSDAIEDALLYVREALDQPDMEDTPAESLLDEAIVEAAHDGDPYPAGTRDAAFEILAANNFDADRAWHAARAIAEQDWRANRAAE